MKFSGPDLLATSCMDIRPLDSSVVTSAGVFKESLICSVVL